MTITVAIIVLFALLISYAILDTIMFHSKQKARVIRGEYTQRFITNKRNGYNWGMK